MLRLLGALKIMSAGLSFGLAGRRSLTQRVERLCTLRWEVGSLRSKILAQNKNLADIFAESELFAPAAAAIREGTPADMAILPLGEGLAGFALFAKGLSSETAEGQLCNIDIFLTELDGEIMRSREEADKRGRLCLGSGVLGAAALILLLI